MLDNPERPYGYTLFCDDIRHEIGGKVSLIGVYGAHLVVEGSFPVKLPKLGFFVVLIVPRTLNLHTMTIKIYVPGNEEDDAVPDIEAEVVLKPFNPEGQLPLLRFAHGLLFSEVFLKRSGKIRVRAVCNGELIKLGTLNVQASSPAQEASTLIRQTAK